jgi:hypothetical protein
VIKIPFVFFCGGWNVPVAFLFVQNNRLSVKTTGQVFVCAQIAYKKCAAFATHFSEAL